MYSSCILILQNCIRSGKSFQVYAIFTMCSSSVFYIFKLNKTVYICCESLAYTICYLFLQLYWLETISEFYFKKKALQPKKKTTDLPQVIDNLYRILLYRVHFAWIDFKKTCQINVREWTIQSNTGHTRRRKAKQIHNTICVLDTFVHK
jgi:hypothetical protein